MRKIEMEWKNVRTMKNNKMENDIILKLGKF
jgi:hypothetical protein